MKKALILTALMLTFGTIGSAKAWTYYYPALGPAPGWHVVFRHPYPWFSPYAIVPGYPIHRFVVARAFPYPHYFWGRHGRF